MLKVHDNEAGSVPKVERVVVDRFGHRKPQRLFSRHHSVIFLSNLLDLASYRDQRHAAASRCSSDALCDGSLFYRFAHAIIHGYNDGSCLEKATASMVQEGCSSTTRSDLPGDAAGQPTRGDVLRLDECRTCRWTIVIL